MTDSPSRRDESHLHGAPAATVRKFLRELEAAPYAHLHAPHASVVWERADRALTRRCFCIALPHPWQHASGSLHTEVAIELTSVDDGLHMYDASLLHPDDMNSELSAPISICCDPLELALYQYSGAQSKEHLGGHQRVPRVTAKRIERMEYVARCRHTVAEGLYMLSRPTRIGEHLAVNAALMAHPHAPFRYDVSVTRIINTANRVVNRPVRTIEINCDPLHLALATYTGDTLG